MKDVSILESTLDNLMKNYNNHCSNKGIIDDNTKKYSYVNFTDVLNKNPSYHSREIESMKSEI